MTTIYVLTLSTSATVVEKPMVVNFPSNLSKFITANTIYPYSVASVTSVSDDVDVILNVYNYCLSVVFLQPQFIGFPSVSDEEGVFQIYFSMNVTHDIP